MSEENKFMEIIRDVLARGAFIMQEDLEEFERKLASLTGAKYAFGVSDGTNAITMGLRACGTQGMKLYFPVILWWRRQGLL